MATDPPLATGASICFPIWDTNAPIASGPQRSEAELRVAFRAFLHAQGLSLAERIVCVAGEPDLVSADRDLIVEVKWRLTKKALCNAIGQVLLYRQAINPKARAIIVGYPTAETLAVLPLVAELGLEVVCWQEGKAEGGRMNDETGQPDFGAEDEASADGEHGADACTMAGKLAEGIPDEVGRDEPPHGADACTMGLAPISDQPRPFRPQPSPFRLLNWNVASLALARGITNPSQLATRLHVGRQGLYAVWNGTSGQVAIAMLARLAHLFQVEPGDWFVWGPGIGAQELSSSLQPPPPRLLWNVAAQAEARGLDIVQLGFRAEVHAASMRPIWRGEAQAVAPATLERLAHALDLPGQPFGIGELFVWRDTNHEPKR